MRVFKSKIFSRFAKGEKISDKSLLEAVDRAMKGLIDADLGGGVIKQRIARPGQGKSCGYRSIVLFRAGDKAFFVYGFAKNERDNITPAEREAFKELAADMLSYSDEILRITVKQGALLEVLDNE
ncbi:MAG: type II toxin-antitoxin system RelE/ParE family toxin [Candidatus Omnitrophota bacterium]